MGAKSWLVGFGVALWAAGAAGAGEVKLATPAASGLISDAASGLSFTTGALPSVSADGRYSVFVSQAVNVVPGQVDLNGFQNYYWNQDVFLHDRVTGTTVLVSRSPASPTTTGDALSRDSAISADGNCVLFTSYASDLVAGQVDNTTSEALFLFDRNAGTVMLVSRFNGSPTSPAIASGIASLSGDGRYVAFSSYAANLVPGDTNGRNDVFLFDRVTETTTLVSHAAGTPGTPANGESGSPVISEDGAFVAFTSSATNLAAGLTDTNGVADAFVWSRAADTQTLASRSSASATTAGNGAAKLPSLSADGRWVAFLSGATNLVTAQSDTNGTVDAFLFDGTAGTTLLVSRSSTSQTATGNGEVKGAMVSGNGAYVAFRSQGTNHLSGQSDTNSLPDAFLFDRATRLNRLVSRTSSSATTAAGVVDTENPSLSSDGAYVAFVSNAGNVVTGQSDANGGADVFVFSRATGTNALASRTAASASTAGAMASNTAWICGNGAFLAFTSAAANLVSGGPSGVIDSNGVTDVYLYARATQTNALASRRDPARPAATAGGSSFFSPFASPTLSADGRWVAFASYAANLIPGQIDTNGATDVFLGDRTTGATILVSRSSASALTAGNRGSDRPIVSADGGSVLFFSSANNLISGLTDQNTGADLFLYDRATGTTRLVNRTPTSATTTAIGDVQYPALSADGNSVAYESSSVNVIAGLTDANSTSDVFVYDKATRTNSLASRTAASATTTGNGLSASVALSRNGRHVAFASRATNLVAGVTDAVADYDVFVFDRVTGTTELISRVAGAPATAANKSSQPKISADGNVVAFRSKAVNLVAGQIDANNDNDLFVFDRATGTTLLATRSSASPVTAAALPAGAFHVDFKQALSAEGHFIAFQSPASNLVAGQTDGNPATEDDVFLFDRAAGTLTLVSHAGGSTIETGNGYSTGPAVSSGGHVTFYSTASNLVDAFDVNETADVFQFDRSLGATTLLSHTDGEAFAGNADSSRPSISGNGRIVAFQSDATDLTPEDWNGESDVFFHVTTVPGFLVTPPAGLLTTEAAGTASFTVALASAPLAAVTLPLSSSNLDEGTVSPVSLTFDALDWHLPQTVTVTGVDDLAADGPTAYEIVTEPALSLDAAYDGLDPADVKVVNADDEAPGIAVSVLGASLVTSEAGTAAAFKVVLQTAPADDVTIPVAGDDASEGSVSPAVLVFTASNWNLPQTVTVTGLDDSLADGDVLYTILLGAAVSADPVYDGLNPVDVTVINEDHE